MPEPLSTHLNFTVTLFLFQPLALAAGAPVAVIVGGVVSWKIESVTDVPIAAPELDHQLVRRPRPGSPAGCRVAGDGAMKSAGWSAVCPFKRIVALAAPPLTDRSVYTPEASATLNVLVVTTHRGRRPGPSCLYFWGPKTVVSAKLARGIAAERNERHGRERRHARRMDPPNRQGRHEPR